MWCCNTYYIDLERPKMVSSFSKWSSHQVYIDSLDAPPYPIRSLWVTYLSELYVSIATRAFNMFQPITAILTNCNLTLYQSESYITCVLTSYISGWSLKSTSFPGLCRKVMLTFILKCILNWTSTRQMELYRDVICIMLDLSCQLHPAETGSRQQCTLKSQIACLVLRV